MITTTLIICFEDQNKMPSFLSRDHLVFISLGVGKTRFVEEHDRYVVSYFFLFPYFLSTSSDFIPEAGKEC